MSAQLFPDDILFYQRLLKTENLYLGKLDGIWGPLTEKASNDFELASDKIRNNIGAFDFRSEAKIRTLIIKAQREARIFLSKVNSEGLNVKIISGTRTYTEQNKLFRIGRYGNPGRIVTKAQGGRSNHNFGIAWDIGIFTSRGGYITESEPYNKAAKVGVSPDLEWGGNWQNFVDRPHYQLKTASTIAEVRKKFETGEGLVPLFA